MQKIKSFFTDPNHPANQIIQKIFFLIVWFAMAYQLGGLL